MATCCHDKVPAKYLKPDLLILDDMGMKQLPKRSGEYLFEIIMRRHELRSTMMTPNRPLEEPHQHVHVTQASGRNGLHREEILGPKRIGVPLHDVVPVV